MQAPGNRPWTHVRVPLTRMRDQCVVRTFSPFNNLKEYSKASLMNTFICFRESLWHAVLAAPPPIFKPVRIYYNKVDHRFRMHAARPLGHRYTFLPKHVALKSTHIIHVVLDAS